MATNTLIQKLFANDESGVGEDVIGSSDRRVIERFRASEVITAGATVSLDLSQTSNAEKSFIVALADGTDACPVGVFDASADSGDPATDGTIYVDIVTRGIVEEALVDGSGTNVAVGDALFISSAGKLVAQAVDEGGAATFNLQAPVAIALEAQNADGTSRVYVISQF